MRVRIPTGVIGRLLYLSMLQRRSYSVARLQCSFSEADEARRAEEAEVEALCTEQSVND